MYLKSDRNDTMKIFFVDKKIFKTVDNGTKICFLLIVEQIIVLVHVHKLNFVATSLKTSLKMSNTSPISNSCSHVAWQ